MSILLDALRKSERQQRKGSLPDIHADDPPPEASREGESRAWLKWSLGAVVVAVLCVYGWKAWQANQVPTAEPEFTEGPPVTADQPRSPPAAEPSAANSEPQTPPARTQPASAAGTATAQVAPGPRLDRQPRSPVETLASDRPLEPAARPPAPDARAEPRPPTDTAAASPPASAQRTEAQRRRDAQLAALQQAVETTGVPEEERAPAPRAGPASRAPDDGAISFWQLPEMTRNSLPELRINVMVYDENPSRRFIIMGGKRYGEGAEISGNLQLEAVQRDRALFRHGAYLFYVKQ